MTKLAILSMIQKKMLQKVVEDLFEKPDIVFCDGSWFKVVGF